MKSVKLTNVPSFLHSAELTADCPELGELVFDVSYGGNFYAIVDVQKNFKGLENYSADKLIAWARELRKRYQCEISICSSARIQRSMVAHIFYGQEQYLIKLPLQEMQFFMAIRPLTVHLAAPELSQDGTMVCKRKIEKRR